MKIEKKLFVAIVMIVGLLVVGNSVSWLHPLFAQEKQTVTTFESSSMLSSPIEETLKATSETTETSGNIIEGSENSDNLTNEDEKSLQTDNAIQPLNIGVQADEVVAEVTNWAELVKAFGTVTVDRIVVKNDFAIPTDLREGFASTAEANTYIGRDYSTSSGGATYPRMQPAGIARKLVVDLNGSTIDFGGVCIIFRDANITGAGSRGNWDITWQNGTIYHGNFYGFTTLNDLSNNIQQNCKITYKDLTNIGNQMIHSPYTDVEIQGQVSTKQESPFTSGLRTDADGNVISWENNATNQYNMLITNLHVAEDAVFEMSTLQAGNVRLENQGSLTMGKNSQMIVHAAQTDSGDEYQGVALDLWGSIIMDEGAYLYVQPKLNRSAVTLRSSGSSVVIGKNAKFEIDSVGHTNNDDYVYRNLLRLSAGATVTVDEEGTLDISAKQMGSSNSSIVYVDGTATFEVKKKGIFNIVSDSTSNSQNLLYFSNNSSTFTFADAQRVNLERTGTISGTSNGLIYIGGNGGRLDVDIQKVSRWNQGELGATPTKVWTPMYGMQIVYNGRTSTVAQAASLTEDAANTFKDEFKTDNTQRVLFEYIPDVNVSINSVATDNVNDDSSYVIRGNTNPGAYVRIKDVPVNNTVEAAMDPADNAIASPAEMASPKPDDPDFTSNFTLQADLTTGNFEYTIPNGKKLVTEGKVKVLAFLEGKYDEAEQTILDKTAPTADPKPYIISVGDAAPNPRALVENVQDTNPLEQTFTYAYADPDKVNALLNTPSEKGHDVDIIVSDNAKNGATITSKLIIWDLGEELKGEDFSVKSNDVAGKTEDELKELVRDHGKLSAFKLFEGANNDLTEQIEITDLGGLKQTPGDYTVTLSVAADPSIGLDAPLSATLVVTVSDDVPPTGTGKPTLVPLDKPEYITEADLKTFLSEYSDNVSANEDITAALVDPDGIADLVATVGEKTIQITLTDEAENTSEPIDVPIPVVKGEVSGDVAITGQDFRIDRSEWEEADANNTLKDFILNKGEVQALEMIGGVVTPVTDFDKISIDDTNVTVDSGHEEQPMEIILTIDNGKDHISQTIKVTFNDKTAPTADPKPTDINIGNVAAIRDSDPNVFLSNIKDNVSTEDKIKVSYTAGQDFAVMVETPGKKDLKIDIEDEAGNKATINVEINVFDNSLTIRFVDSKDKDIVTAVVISDKIPGNKVDLTQNQDVLRALKDAEDLNYQLLTRPDDETEVEVTSTGKIVKYEFDGTLFISSYPEVLDFKTHEVWFSNIRVDKPQYQNPLVIWDNRGTKADWTLTATLTKDFTLKNGDEADPNFVLTDVLSYQVTDEETSAVLLHDQAEPVFTAKHTEEQAEYNISDTWTEDGAGLKFETPVSKVKKLGEYQAEILWTLGDAR
ncbi:pectate lyase-like adhesive domain-containing protein [Enterococcus sp. S86.2]|uniref:pectate lyase-like adhesive domain-containing protein n=1 Tax=Enterococcus sp. S86.2 TaxID=3031299 RepID=UPI0026E93EEC|nr:pectate lyase-like adhesive domain-containing protein [Enterococcus sp. S86.2]